MPRPIINLADVPLRPLPATHAVPTHLADRFEVHSGELGGAVGSQKLGYNLTVLAPGKRAFPRHNHWVNEEMFMILEGTGELRLGDEVHPIRPGDVICCLAGGRDTAHQIVNTGVTEMRYLAVSTMQFPEVVEYPDSDKFGIRADRPGSDGPDGNRVFRFRGREAQSLDYWDGE